jgi:hypothetical protein
MSGVTRSNRLRADEEAVLVALQREIAAIDDQLGALRRRPSHQAQDVFLGHRR